MHGLCNNLPCCKAGGKLITAAHAGREEPLGQGETEHSYKTYTYWGSKRITVWKAGMGVPITVAGMSVKITCAKEERKK